MNRRDPDPRLAASRPSLDLRWATQRDVMGNGHSHVETPSQTAGPYVHIGLMPDHAGLESPFAQEFGPQMRKDAARGDAITLRGRVLDGTGSPMRDAVIECWQADAEGRFTGMENADPAFGGFGRSACDPETGEWRFDTVRPGRVPWHDGRLQAPHVSLFVIARGINIGLHTRAYFAGDPLNDQDPLLSAIQPPDRAGTMIARDEEGGRWHLDIRVQRGPSGEAETVFLDI